MEQYIPISRLPETDSLSADDLFMLSRETGAEEYRSMNVDFGRIVSETKKGIDLEGYVSKMNEISSKAEEIVDGKADEAEADRWILARGVEDSYEDYSLDDGSPNVLYGIKQSRDLQIISARGFPISAGIDLALRNSVFPDISAESVTVTRDLSVQVEGTMRSLIGIVTQLQQDVLDLSVALNNKVLIAGE